MLSLEQNPTNLGLGKKIILINLGPIFQYLFHFVLFFFSFTYEIYSSCEISQLHKLRLENILKEKRKLFFPVFKHLPFPFQGL